MKSFICLSYERMMCVCAMSLQILFFYSLKTFFLDNIKGNKAKIRANASGAYVKQQVLVSIHKFFHYVQLWGRWLFFSCLQRNTTPYKDILHFIKFYSFFSIFTSFIWCCLSFFIDISLFFSLAHRQFQNINIFTRIFISSRIWFNSYECR